MNWYRLAVVAALVAVGLAFVSVGAAMGDASLSASQTDEETESSMGEKMGAFMQSSTAEADGSIDRGMFESSLNESDDPNEAVRERIAALEAKYDELANRSATLEGNSTLPEPARRAQLTRLAVQLDSLDTSINETERHARTAGVDTESLDRLRANASKLSGPEVDEIAKGLAGVDPPGLSDDHPSNDNPGKGNNQGNGSDNPGKGGDEPGNGSEDPGNGSDDPGNGDPRGPPEDPGPPSDDGSDDES